MARIAVTGGAGFLGSHLCERLIGEGHEVVALDNLSTGQIDNLAGLRREPRFSFVSCDVARGIDLTGPLQAVVHLASPASPKDFESMQCEILAAGADGTRHGLELAQAAGAVFLLASTSEVYGEAQVHPQREDYRGNVDPTSLRGVYDEAKRFAEAATMAWRRARGVDGRVVRIFNTYGPRMRLDDGRVLPNFLSQALRGEPLTIFGSGSQTRSFCYVDDLVEGLVRALSVQDLPVPVNLGNPEEVTIRALADEVIALVGCSPEVRHRPLPQGDTATRQPDIGRAQRWLGWAPQVRRAVGLRLTYLDVARREALRSGPAR